MVLPMLDALLKHIVMTDSFTSRPVGTEEDAVGLEHPAGKPREGEGLEPDPTGASQYGKKETFTSEEGGFYSTGLLNVEIDRRFIRQPGDSGGVARAGHRP